MGAQVALEGVGVFGVVYGDKFVGGDVGGGRGEAVGGFVWLGGEDLPTIAGDGSPEVGGFEFDAGAAVGSAGTVQPGGAVFSGHQIRGPGAGHGGIVGGAGGWLVWQGLCWAGARRGLIRALIPAKARGAMTGLCSAVKVTIGGGVSDWVWGYKRVWGGAVGDAIDRAGRALDSYPSHRESEEMPMLWYKLFLTLVIASILSVSITMICMAQPDHRPTREGQQHGDQTLPEGRVTIEVRDGYRYISANGLPEHEPGKFPNRGNPNTIAAQDYGYRVPVEPKVADEATPMDRMPFGVGLNGVPFDPGTAEFWTPNGRRMHDRSSGWNYDALSGKINLGIDDHHAHVQPTGAYHYHGLPTGLIHNQIEKKHGDDGGPGMTMVGYAADGFPIYTLYGYEDADDTASAVIKLNSSYRVKRGDRPTSPDGPGGRYDGTFVQDFEYVPGAGDLDECNGRLGVTPEYPDGTYYYVITDTFPYIPRMFRGEPDESFMRRGPGRGSGDRMDGPPPENRPGGRRPPPPR